MQADEARQEAIAWFDDKAREAFIEYVDKAFASGAIDTEDITWLEIRAILLITAESFVNERVANQTKTLENLRHFL